MPLADSDEPSGARMHTSLRHCGKEPADGVHQERPELREPSRDMVTTVTSVLKMRGPVLVISHLYPDMAPPRL